MRGLWLLAAAAVLPVPAGPLPGQGAGDGAWHVVNERGTVSVQPVPHGAYQALPLSTLVSVGAQVSYGRGTVDVQLGAATLRFRIGSAEVGADPAPFRLEGEVYEDRGVVFVPLGFFRTFLPSASAGRVTVDAAAREIRGSVPLPAAIAAGSASRQPGAVFESVTWAVPDSLRDEPPRTRTRRTQRPRSILSRASSRRRPGARPRARKRRRPRKRPRVPPLPTVPRGSLRSRLRSVGRTRGMDGG
jgi:hypothetical protein